MALSDYDSLSYALISEIAANIRGQFASAVTTEVAATSRIMEFMGTVFADETFVKQNGKRIEDAHRDIGHAAQRSMVNSYTHRNPRRPKNSYRQNDTGVNKRYAGGKLLEALQKPEHVVATSRGLRFLDTGILDTAARQWRRLNFGAGGVHGRAPVQFKVEWDGLVVASIGAEPDPRPGFTIPKGYWFNGQGERVGASPDGGDSFYPVGSAEMPTGRRGRPSPMRQTRGIVATNFLDAGIRTIANQIPVAYTQLYRDMHDQALERLSVHAERLGATLPDPGETQVFVQYQRDRTKAGGFTAPLRSY